jgi:hypothetical protein
MAPNFCDFGYAAHLTPPATAATFFLPLPDDQKQSIQLAGSFLLLLTGISRITRFFAGKCPKRSSPNVNKAERHRTHEHHGPTPAISEVSNDVHDLQDTGETILHEAAWTFLLG